MDFLLKLYPNLSKKHLIVLLDGDIARILTTEEKLTESQILACIHHISENIKERLAPFLKSKKSTSSRTPEPVEKVSDDYVFICETCRKMRVCASCKDVETCVSAGISCDDPEDTDGILGDLGDKENVENLTLDTDESRPDNVNDQTTEEFIKIYNTENLNWYKVWDSIRYLRILV